jgi:HSP20 family protein
MYRNNNSVSIWDNGLAPLGRFFEDFVETIPEVANWRTASAHWQPACDVEEAKDHYLLSMDMPGVPKNQIKIEVVDNQLLVSGERKQEEKKNIDGAWYAERRFGKFHRSFSLPVGVDSEKVEANYEDGILTIYVPKAESAKPRQVKITNAKGTGFLGRLIGSSSDHEESKVAS